MAAPGGGPGRRRRPGIVKAGELELASDMLEERLWNKVR